LYTALAATGPQSCCDLSGRTPVLLCNNQLRALMTRNHFPWAHLWRYWKWPVWSQPFPSNAAVALGEFPFLHQQQLWNGVLDRKFPFLSYCRRNWRRNKGSI